MTFFFISIILTLYLFKPKKLWQFYVTELPSTILHEFSHWIFALCLGCKPELPSLIPHKDPKSNNWILGSVNFEARMGKSALISLAPVLLLLPFSTFFYMETVSHINGLFKDPFKLGLNFLLFLTVTKALIPSPQDWFIFIKDLAGWPFVGIVSLIDYVLLHHFIEKLYAGL